MTDSESLRVVAEAATSENVQEDARLERVSSYTITTMGLNVEKWQTMMGNEELKLIVLDWLNNARRRVLLFTLNPAGFLVPINSLSDIRRTSFSQNSNSAMFRETTTSIAVAATSVTIAPTIGAISNITLPLPGSSFSTLDGVPRGKATYFLKREPLVVTFRNFHNEILFGDLPLHSKVETLAILLEQIYIPLLSNPFNRKFWPQVVSHDLDGKMKDIRNNVQEIKGKTNNKTILSLLVSATSILEMEGKLQNGDSTCDEHFQSTLEEMIINWTTQIHEILSVKSECINNNHNNDNILPANEVAFWNGRKFHLQDVYEQMKTPAIVCVARILERIGSIVYSESFHKIFKDLIMALQEALDISLWLSPIIRQTAAFSAVNFINSMDLVEPLVHVIHLIWTNSRYYSTSKRMSVLLKSICNLLVYRASEDLEFPILFQGEAEADEGLVKITRTVKILEYFKSKVCEYKNQYGYRQSDNSHNSSELWKFSADEVFSRLDGFLNQLSGLRSIFQLAASFQCLEKLEIGGMCGKYFKDQIMNVHLEFKQVLTEWSQEEIDINNTNSKWKKFQKKQDAFFRRTDVLEKMLATILIKSFAQSFNVEQVLKLVIMFRDFLKRPVILSELQVALPGILKLLSEELDKICISISAISEEGVFPRKINFPPLSLSLMWIDQNEQRTEMLCDALFENALNLGENSDYQQIKDKRNTMQSKLREMRSRVWNNWHKSIDSKIEKSLKEFVFYWKNENSSSEQFVGEGIFPRHLAANLPDELFKTIREVKYVKAVEPKVEALPKNALELYNLRNDMWKRKNILMKIENFYNDIYEKAHPCEFELISEELVNINDLIDMTCATVTWKQYDTPLVINILEKLSSLHDRFKRTQQNLTHILRTVKYCCNEPLHQRCPFGKNFLDLRVQKDRFGARLKRCDESRLTINRLIEDNISLFNNKDLKNSENDGELTYEPKFQNYLQFINNLINREIRESIKRSLEYLITEMGPKDNGTPTTPLFEVKLELINSEIIFTPSLEPIKNENIGEMIKSLIDDIFSAASRVPTLYKDKVDFSKNDELSVLVKEITNRTSAAIEDAKRYGDKFNSMQFLWMEETDIMESMKSQYCGNNATVNSFLIMEGSKKEIDRYNDLYEDIEHFESYQVINGLLAIDVNPLKHALLNYACKRANSFKQWLLQYVMDTLKAGCIVNSGKMCADWTVKYPLSIVCIATFSLIAPEPLCLQTFNRIVRWFGFLANRQLETINLHTHTSAQFAIEIQVKPAIISKNLHTFSKPQQLENFITSGTRALALHIGREDFRSLLEVLSIMFQIKERECEANNIFKPLRDIINLLKSYNTEFDPCLLKDIDQLPIKWKTLKDTAVSKIDGLAEIKDYQQNAIRGVVEIFNCRVNSFFESFQMMKFFSVPCDDVYSLCDAVYRRLDRFKQSRKRILHCAKLLEIPASDDTKLVLCEAEVKRVKQLWDFVHVIQSCIIDWKSTPWCRIDTDDVENECKKFTRELRTLDKSVRTWKPYEYIVSVLKDLVSSLRVITELQNPAITERHWMELMSCTKLTRIHSIDSLMQLHCNKETTLDDLLTLGLHRFDEEVKSTVDKAIKEITVTKALEEIKATWAQMEFDSELHKPRQLHLLRVSEELVETLDENQMQLQNISTSKHIDYLLPKLNHWQKILSNVDLVITHWFDVQRKWIYLESIFIGSEDIRKQLPDDAERFEAIDKEFTRLLEEVGEIKLVIRVAENQHIYTALEELELKLSICEKALSDYLETKRLAFPRFYFISSADLLDILSNGNCPRIVCRHLIKLFDSVMRLEFASEHSNSAVGMYSKENDEYVSFLNIAVECTGQVESWLNELIKRMKGTLHALFKNALKEIAQKSKENWLSDWPAQTALCCSQIFWTSAVNTAFAWLEEGYESAMKDLQKHQIAQLNTLINLLLRELSPGDRQKIMTICTIDVHNRDVVLKIIQQKVENALAFQWQSQLRHRWDETKDNCYANICDAEFLYDFEYLGNTSRLVITPLTDRCYITLTQSLHLVMGGAPAGPAGTGKTETTKDLGRALGVMVYVFNCSEQMDYKSCGNIYKGLSQTGAWGCFDEFNRISVEVLSVVAVQVKTIQEAIKMKKTQFAFMGESISLVSSVGIFITMNPGYAGRTELPENLKMLFRPCAMIVPDFALICEIMLVAEGFQDARLLARKFITLYTLCRELLSKQDHYDWGLRAIKSVLVVAGGLKREDHTRPEDQVLMRALRDFNIPKIVTEDVAIFMGLIGDLFPAIEVPRKRLFELERAIRRAVNELRLQPQDGFLIKVVQLQELLNVRHSVFIVGDAGTGKTKIWQTLLETYNIQKLKPVCSVLNPKAMSSDELFGVVNPTTREWKDGLFSSVMRDQANIKGDQNCSPKWIVLDGDIDPMWIESLNTLMDDNKILTLASNERIVLSKEMRLIFEVGHLKAATPATVSRAGVLYINPQDLGWFPYVSSWLETRPDIVERGLLTRFFEKYFPSMVNRSQEFKKTTPITDMAMIQMTCHLIESLLDSNQRIEAESMETTLEIIFAFAAIWGFGSALCKDHIIDWHREFHKWWTSEFKDVKFPSHGTIFDYFPDNSSQKFLGWETQIEEIKLEPDIPLQNILVPTADTVRLEYFLKLLIRRNLPILLVGTSGCGKGAILRHIFNSATSESQTSHSEYCDRVLQTTHFNFYTTSEMFQKILDKPLEKKSGRCYGPNGNKRLIYYVNDLNMPEVDAYGTVQPHTIIRQFMDYRQWYDRSRLVLKDIRNCQFVASMNPTAGSFTIDPRLQRHFCVFSVHTPNEAALSRIYSTILSHHLDNPLNGFSKEIKPFCSVLVNVSVCLQCRIENAFLPTALKFHYVFNLQDMTNIYQGLLNCSGVTCTKSIELVRLYVHEAFRVYHDRFVDQHDIKAFEVIIRDVLKKNLEDFDEEYVFAHPLIYSHFAQSLADQKYMPIQNWDVLYQLLTEAQANYNDSVGYMNLVMFEDAMLHVCRINRILENSGNALLIGVGGSGKQSLARLASFISSLSVFQMQLKRGYGLQDMREDLAALYIKVGLKSVMSVFLLSDAQISNEYLLTLCNDMLASGEIPQLFSEDQIEMIYNGIRNEVKQSGQLDTKDNCWRFFINKVRRMLRIVLCFSPVGPTLRIRVRKFRAIISRTCIDWFHEWPNTALQSVSKKFLSEIDDILPANIIESVGCFMAYVHETVNQISKIYLQNEKRFNYTTPKTFLEYIFLYRKLMLEKYNEHCSRIERLESGMAKLAECACQVDTLKDQLAIQEVQLNSKNIAADKLIVIITAESDKVQKEKLIASEEEKRVRIIEEDVSIKTQMFEEDLRKAEPALVAAQAALNTLNKNNLTELKSFGSPPKAVVNVCAAVMVLLALNGKIPRDRSWKSAKLMMVRVDQFLNDLVNYDKDNIHPNIIETLQEYLRDPEFNPDKIVQKSVAAGGLCAWVINLHRYHQVFLIVGPKQKALQDSQEELKSARERLKYLKTKISTLEGKLHEIQSEFEEAIGQKQKCQKEADKTAFTIDLARRLVNGLANENIRWKESVLSLKEKIEALPGDILLISSFLSYVGSFTRRYRIELRDQMWLPFFKKSVPKIPHSANADFFKSLHDEARIAMWNNQGLPMDQMSTENATILTYSNRWPLMIDPQLQGIKWIKNTFGNKLISIRLCQKGYLEVLEKAISSGDTVLIEQIEETIDTVLDPLLNRALVKKGRYIKIGDKELDFHPSFRLILQTKLANPHYKPELQAQMTLINFTVTQDGLEEQLLAEVVKIERPDLEEMKIQVTIQQNKFKISLKDLEDELLARLASSGKNVLDDHALVINLETTKNTVDEIETKVAEANITTLQIDETRNIYRAAAQRASVLFFVLSDLNKINPMYKFSLKSFMIVFRRAISLASTQTKTLEERVALLVNSITFQSFRYTMRGLFERDKLIFTFHMIIRIMLHSKSITKDEIDFLLRYPHDPNVMSPVDFINRASWGGIRNLASMEHFYGIDKDIENYPKRWKNFLQTNVPEKEVFPGEWKHRTALQKLCIIRALRPDRLTYSMRHFIEKTMGGKYSDVELIAFSDTFQEVSPTTPVLFILSPGVDPVHNVEALGIRLKFSTENGNLYNISLGQGQEVVAEKAIEIALKQGRWVILQNIHLVVNWLSSLEKIIENIDESVHADFRLFISAEPALDPQYHIIPQGILESSIKIVNEPPTGMAPNLHKAWDNFDQEFLEKCTQEAEFKSILFVLCYFHSVVGERRKFGPLGWNKVYPFNIGDLNISAYVLYNYLEGSNRIPWEDLRYLFGEIMYGGHITDDWDRRLCQTYLEELLRQDLIDGEFELCPGFPSPPNMEFSGYHEYITEMLPDESPVLYGLHPNAEISFLTAASETLLNTIFELQPRESELNSSYEAPREELVKIAIDEFLDKLQDEFNLCSLLNRIEKKTPFVVVSLQECERMNALIREIKRSLRELLLGLKGELTITAEMERLHNAIFYNYLPKSWTRLAYPSMMGLQGWFADLIHRIKELAVWLNDFKLPCVIWLGGLFNPQSFLTAIMQESARKHDLPLDRMCLSCDVTKKDKEDINLPPMEGAFVHSLYLDGASWDCNLKTLVPLRSKEIICTMPVIYVKSIVQEKQDVLRRVYECPLYKTRSRGSTYVWTFNLNTKDRPSKWILGGVALLLQS